MAGNMSVMMICIVAEVDRKRLFVSPTAEHIQTARSAKPDSYPTQKMPTTAYLVSGRGYGIENWHQLFTERQLSALTTFIDMAEKAGEQAREDGADEQYANAIKTYLALAVGRLSNGNSSLGVWHAIRENIEGPFGRQAITMVWDFPEANPFSNSSKNWTGMLEGVIKTL